LIFRFYGRASDVIFLFWNCVSHFTVIVLLEKVSNRFDLAFLSIALKNNVSLATPDNSKLF